MHPYRDLPIEKAPGVTRSYFKTMYWKLLIRVKGTWRDRFYRGCGHPGCTEVHVRVDGGLLDFQPIYCQMRHYRMQGKRK